MDRLIGLVSVSVTTHRNLVMNGECDAAFVGPEIGYVSMRI